MNENKNTKNHGTVKTSFSISEKYSYKYLENKALWKTQSVRHHMCTAFSNILN